MFVAEVTEFMYILGFSFFLEQQPDLNRGHLTADIL
jgi:hypothetical protein